MNGQISVYILLLLNVCNWHVESQLTKQERDQLVEKLTQKLQEKTTKIPDASLVKAFQLLSVQRDQEKDDFKFPIVVNTWGFVNATARAWENLMKYDDSLAAVVTGCTECEDLQCDGTVGYGGSPDESGETTLDALIMNGKNHDAGSVAGLRRVKSAAAVAQAVMTYTKHTLLVGESATQFAIAMGFEQEDLHTKDSMNKWIDWNTKQCQPNFRLNVSPDPSGNCGPYKPVANNEKSLKKRYNDNVSAFSHDTIGIIAINSKGDIAGGTSTNGASHKIPGRVGDSPIIGSGAYVDNEVGGAAGTGDGDTLMKFLPAYQAVESMRNGMSPGEAAADAISRITKYYENFSGAILAIDKHGNHGAACHGLDSFPYSVRNSSTNDVIVVHVSCI